MTPPIEHFDLTGKRAVVYAADNIAGAAVADALAEAGARVARLDALATNAVGQRLKDAIAELGGLDVLAAAPDLFLAKPISEISAEDLGEVLMANFGCAFSAAQEAVKHMSVSGAGNIILLTHVLGERGLPNTSIYSAAHGAVQGFIRALAQEVAPAGIVVNGIALGWMDWMSDRLDPTDPEAARAVRFTMSKRAGSGNDIGPLAVWLAGSGVGFVTGQIFPVDGGLTQHL